ncbi:hypothetical protein PIB30_002402 [Stylosanthes scabra]|uniref:Uncharacterized protein n=1 Tax=Stylosanthes scabra TaxID=79078 RepID=A0ABU6W480_9FABA|nr:hypothetical protein [Stylosanthes scabra]
MEDNHNAAGFIRFRRELHSVEEHDGYWRPTKHDSSTTAEDDDGDCRRDDGDWRLQKRDRWLLTAVTADSGDRLRCKSEPARSGYKVDSNQQRPQTQGGSASSLSLLRNLTNGSAARGLVKMSATCSVVGMYTMETCLFITLSLTK